VWQCVNVSCLCVSASVCVSMPSVVDLREVEAFVWQCVAVCCNVLQYGAVCCSVLHCVAVQCGV